MDLNALIGQLGTRLGLPALALDPQTRSCRLVFDSEYPVDIEATDEETFFLHATVCEVQPDAPAAVFSRVLAAGLFGRHTGKASFGFDEQRLELVLFQRLQLPGTDLQGLESELECFVNVLCHWCRLLARGDQPDFAATPAIDPLLATLTIPGAIRG